MKGKPWTVEDEKKLAKLVKDKKTLDVIAETLGKSPEAVRKKIERLKLEVVDQALQQRTTTSNKLRALKRKSSLEKWLKLAVMRMRLPLSLSVSQTRFTKKQSG